MEAFDSQEECKVPVVAFAWAFALALVEALAEAFGILEECRALAVAFAWVSA